MASCLRLNNFEASWRCCCYSLHQCCVTLPPTTEYRLPTTEYRLQNTDYNSTPSRRHFSTSNSGRNLTIFIYILSWITQQVYVHYILILFTGHCLTIDCSVILLKIQWNLNIKLSKIYIYIYLRF